MANRQQRSNEPVTTGAIVAEAQGINLICRCGHRTSLLPAQIASLAKPDTRVADFKRRFTCSMCGRRGSSGEIQLKTFAVPEALACERRPPRTPRSRH